MLSIEPPRRVRLEVGEHLATIDSVARPHDQLEVIRHHGRCYESPATMFSRFAELLYDRDGLRSVQSNGFALKTLLGAAAKSNVLRLERLPKAAVLAPRRGRCVTRPNVSYGGHRPPRVAGEPRAVRRASEEPVGHAAECVQKNTHWQAKSRKKTKKATRPQNVIEGPTIDREPYAQAPGVEGSGYTALLPALALTAPDSCGGCRSRNVQNIPPPLIPDGSRSNVTSISVASSPSTSKLAV